MILLIKLVLSILFVAAFVILNFSIFKIPIKGNDKQIAILALIVGGVNFYFKFVVDSSYFMLIQSITYIILLALMRRYPLLYSLLVCTVGSVISTALDAGVSFGAAWLNLSTFDLMNDNLLHFTLFHIVQIIIYLLISFLLTKKKIGFSFVYHKFYVMEKYNVIWMVLLVLVTSGLTFGSLHFNVFSMHGYILLIITAALIGLLIYGFFQNKRSLRDRYDPSFFVRDKGDDFTDHG
ncbi:hypothetical protein [Paenibacillus sedimenti]|uniref:Uncharacterized protein n=1 Tax=Paenibacillus sedimenti TaxID=2770274 RepID=A0A926KP11_9BACL|nr:hypothetical protein [Paenibacillus sedimenti]MBD0381255.1 hypothetical protein [Paenibacillus sedimenti]